MDIARRKPSVNEWLGMEGVLSREETKVELGVLKTIKADGFISTCRHPHVRKEHIERMNRLFEEFHYTWRVGDESGQSWPQDDDLYIFHIHTQRVSTTA